jgi:uncharacterized protein (DUF58 family)
VTLDVARPAASLRQLELLVMRRLDGILQGEHQGLVPGGGAELAGGRLYEAGDDVRRMDWNLTARSSAPHVRTTIADRELETWLVVDCSASLDFGTARCEKRDLALAAVAAFGFLTTRDGNRVGALLAGPGGDVIVPPRTGRSAVLTLLRLVDRRPRADEGAVSLADALRRVRRTARRRSLMVVVTDLLDTGEWQRELRALGARHDVVVVEVRDPRESDLPPTGLLTLVDPETGRRLEVQTANPKIRKRFAEAAAHQRTEHRRAVRAAGAAHLIMSTDRDWLRDVISFVAQRRRLR